MRAAQRSGDVLARGNKINTVNETHKRLANFFRSEYNKTSQEIEFFGNAGLAEFHAYHASLLYDQSFIQNEIRKGDLDENASRLIIKGILKFEKNEFLSDRRKFKYLLEILKKDGKFLKDVLSNMTSQMKWLFVTYLKEVRKSDHHKLELGILDSIEKDGTIDAISFLTAKKEVAEAKFYEALPADISINDFMITKEGQTIYLTLYRSCKSGFDDCIRQYENLAADPTIKLADAFTAEFKAFIRRWAEIQERVLLIKTVQKRLVKQKQADLIDKMMKAE